MIHTLLEMITPESPNAYLITPLILRQFAKDSAKLKAGWNEESFQNLEMLRKYAQDNEHCIEEAFILLFENRYLREKHKDNDKFLEVVRRLNVLQGILDRDDDYFREIYRNIYPKTNRLVRKSIDLLIRDMYGKVDSYADFFSGNLDFKTAQLCGKVMQKIAIISPENVTSDQTMEALFGRAMDYGNIRDLNSAFHFYDLAIEKALADGDKAYLYIAIQRKLSICTGLVQLDSQTNFDTERMECVRALNGMITDGISNIEELGNVLVSEEMEKKRKAPRRAKKYYQSRIDKIREAIPILSLQLAMARGDEQTSRIYIERLKKEECRAYGCNPGFSAADMFDIVYSMLFNSPEREEYEKGKSADDDQPAEDNVLDLPPFMEEMIPAQKFNCTLFLVRNFIIHKMFKSAENCCGHLLLLADKAKSDYHMAMALNAHGQVLEAQNMNAKAIWIYKEALNLLEDADKSVSDADLSPYLYYNLLCEIGNLTKEDDPEASVCYYKKAMEWLEKHNMSQMLFLYHILNGRADAYQRLEKLELADNDRAEFLKFAINETKKRIMLLDSDSRDIFWNDTSSLIYRTIAHIRPDSSDIFKTEAYNAVLLSKGMLLASEKSVKDIALGTSGMKQLYEELEENERNRKKWGTSDTVEEYTEGYLKSMKLVSELENALPGRDGFLHTNMDDIIHALGERDILVEYFDYEIEGGDRQYIAFVLRNGSGVPEIMELCKESDLVSFFETQMKAGSVGKEVEFSVIYEPFYEESHRLQGMIWKPVEDFCKIRPFDRIWFVPSGSLHKVAVESLPFGESWSHTLCDRYPLFARLSHARMLFDTEAKQENRTAVIFADPDYGSDSRAEASDEKGYSVRLSEHVYEEPLFWPSLPQTREEAKNLQDILCQANWTIDVFAGKEATSENFRRMNGNSPAIVHISTHGFAETRKSAQNIPALSSYHKPLDLTGIVLADGNKGWSSGTKCNHEGIILASEIAGMDLSGADMVFVSCCFSGEGIVKPDGIYGIQRALKKAGVRTVIMSLWAENGEAGKVFAEKFYRLYLNGTDKNEAFKRAKQTTRENVKKRYKDENGKECEVPDPYLWAGFIMLD